MVPDPKPDLEDAYSTEDIYDLAFRLGAWGLRNGECDIYSVVEWVLSHPHAAKLPRGNKGIPNATNHHIAQGASRAGEQFVPGYQSHEFDPEPLHALAARIAGSGARHELYLLAAVALCFRYETYRPVITGPNLADAANVHTSAAGKVISEWAWSKADGFFTGITYDGQPGHGRRWSVNLSWEPLPKVKHLPGCNRAKARCRCEAKQLGCHAPSAAGTSQAQVSQKSRSIFPSAEKDRSTKVRQFQEWVATLKPRDYLTVSSVASELGITRPAAKKLLTQHQGTLLDECTFKGVVRERKPGGGFHRVRCERWFVADPALDMSNVAAGIELRVAAAAARKAGVSECLLDNCGGTAPPGQSYCPPHQDAMDRLNATR